MADKLTTALFLSRTRASWTSLRDKKGTWEVAEQVDAPIEAADDADVGSQPFAAQVKSRCSGVKGVVTLVLPTSSALVRVAEFPTADADEIRSMADLQVERFSPFPADQMCVGYEILSQSQDKSRVLVAAAPRGTVDALQASFASSGVSPLRVDVEIMGWWWLLKSKGQIADAGRQVLLVLSGDSAELVVSQDGLPVLIRSLAMSVSDAKTNAGELAEELDYTLTTAETEWGSAPVDRVHLWSAGDISEDLCAAFCSASSLRVDRHALADLPPVTEGVARRIAESSVASLDMAPPEWKATAISKEAQKKVTLFAISVLMIWMAALGGLYWYSQHEQMNAFRFRERIKSLDKKAGEVRELQKQAQSLQRYADRTFSAIECLREVCSRMPAGPELDLFTYEKYNVVSMRGYSDADNSAIDFVAELQKSGLFPKVDPGNSSQVNHKGRQRWQFKVTIKLPEEKKPDEKKPGEKKSS